MSDHTDFEIGDRVSFYDEEGQIRRGTITYLSLKKTRATVEWPGGGAQGVNTKRLAIIFQVGDVVVPDYEGSGLVGVMEGSKAYVKETLAKTTDGQMLITEVTESLYLAYKCEYYRTVDTWAGEPVWDFMYFEANELKKVG